MKPPDSTILAKRVRCVLPILIAFAVLAAFWPTLGAEFVSWDDDANFLNNAHFRGLGWQNLRWMFTTLHMSNYQPLSWLTSALGYSLWGMHPLGYHATSVAFHALNAVLFYFVAERLLRHAGPAADELTVSIAATFAALFFAVHPLRTEAVAWLSGQHDLQAAAFWLLAILCYLRACSDKARRWRWLAGTTALFAAAMLSKANGITLPFILLLLDVYPLRRLPTNPRLWGKPQHRQILIEKLPPLWLQDWSAWSRANRLRCSSPSALASESSRLSTVSRSIWARPWSRSGFCPSIRSRWISNCLRRRSRPASCWC
jgi:hypothetical protein